MSLNTILKTYSGTISLLCFCAICSIIIFTSDRTTYTSVSATRLFLNGEAKQYKEEYMERMEILEDDSISIAFVKPFTVHPTLLATDDDFTPNSENWLNIEGSKYFNKVAIILEE